MKDSIPPASWEVFDECPVCFTAPQKPCYRIDSKSKNLVENKTPHRGRKRLRYEPG